MLVEGNKVRKRLTPFQLGCGMSSECEKAAIIFLDMKNAFGAIRRQVVYLNMHKN